MAISAEFVNPFIDAAISVAAKVAGISMRRGHLAYKRQPDPSYSVSIIIGVYGYLTGQVVYSMKKELADRLVERMLEGCSAAEKQALYQDTLGELANMITGNATSALNQRKEIALGITTPAIATGADLNISLINIPTLALGLYSQFGPIEINVALKESAGASRGVDHPGDHAAAGRSSAIGVDGRGPEA
jgi:chemotaxis protein CheX